MVYRIKLFDKEGKELEHENKIFDELPFKSKQLRFFFMRSEMNCPLILNTK